MPPVPKAGVTEAEVLDWLGALFVQFGAKALEKLEPGTTLVDRLRYCRSRLMLARAPEVLPELQRLAERHPENPMVWRGLGNAQLLAGNEADADASLRRAYDLDAASRFARCPTLPSYLGGRLLRRPATRERGVAILRRELAEGHHPAKAAIALAALFEAEERHAEAIACLDAGLRRDPNNKGLRGRKAVTLLQVMQTPEAVEILKALAAGEDSGLVPITWLMRAHWLDHDFDATIVVARRLAARSDLPEHLRKEVRGVIEQALTAKEVGRRGRFKNWELSAILRGDKSIGNRTRVLDLIGSNEQLDFVAGGLRIAWNCDEPILRGRALQIQFARFPDRLANLREGFGDPDPKVRGIAADLITDSRVDRGQAVRTLLEFLAKERDSYAFRVMHASLNKLTHAGIDLPYGAAEDPAKRRAIVERWRQRQ